MTDIYAPSAGSASTVNHRLLGLIAFIIGASAVVITRLLGLVTPFVIQSGMSSGYGLIATLGVITTALSLVLGLAALVLGLIVLLNRGAPKGFAAAGAALGGSELVSALIGFGQSAMYGFMG